MTDAEVLRHPARHTFGVFSWSILQTIYKIHVSKESGQNIAKLDDHLRSGEPGVLYVNHVRFGDTPKMIAFILANAPHAGKLMAPVAIKYVDPKRNLPTAIALELLTLFGMQALPIVQDKEKHLYSAETSRGLVNALGVAVETAIYEDGTLVGWTPEAMRNPNAKLLQAKPGIGRLRESDLEGRIMYAPVGLIYRGIHPEITQNEIRIGTPFSLEELDIEASQLPANPREHAAVYTKAMMYRLASILPESMRGVYSSVSPTVGH